MTDFLDLSTSMTLNDLEPPEIAKKSTKLQKWGFVNFFCYNFWLQRTFHTSHDSVTVVRTTFKVCGKRQSLTLSQPKTSEPIVTKFECRD